MKLSQAFPSKGRARIYVTVTAGRGLSAEQAEKVEGFLAEFLPRLRQEPGVREIMHGASLEGHDLTTIVV